MVMLNNPLVERMFNKAVPMEQPKAIPLHRYIIPVQVLYDKTGKEILRRKIA